MTNPFPRVFYVYDALCGWCYGFKSNILKLEKEYRNKLAFEVLSGNMVPPENAQHISVMAGYIANAYQRVEELSGCKFGEPYLQHIFHPEKSDWTLNSELPSIALSAYKRLEKGNNFEFAADIQNLLMLEGKDITKPMSYMALCEKYDVDQTLFFEMLREEESRDLAHAEYAMVKQLKITGFPCVLVQTDERKLYMIAKGYTAFDDLKLRLDKVLEDFRIANN